MQMPDPWASLVLPDPGSACAALHILKGRCDGSDWHISTQSIPLQLCYWPWACFPFPPPSQRQPFHSHVCECSPSVWDPLGFFLLLYLSACLVRHQIKEQITVEHLITACKVLLTPSLLVLWRE